MAIGSGGLTGIGMFVDGSMSQLNYVPADWTDFIYATIGEAWGFVGCMTILVMYILILLRMLYLAYYTRDKYGRLIICGVMGMLLFHVFEKYRYDAWPHAHHRDSPALPVLWRLQ